jgi:adenylate cyclase
MGRQIRGADDAPYSCREDARAKRWRVVIARADEDTVVSRTHVVVKPLGGQRVQIENASSMLPVLLQDGSELKPRASCEVPLPTSFTVDIRKVSVNGIEALPPWDGLEEVSIAPGQASIYSSRFPAHAVASGSRIEIEQVLRWLQTTMNVLQSAANASDFFRRAAQAVVDVVGLDSGALLLWTGGDWKTEAFRTTQGQSDPGDWSPSRQVLNKVRAEKRPVWHIPTPESGQTPSLIGVTVVVAAPILNRQEEVIGALYGDRQDEGAALPARKLEALVLELLAGGVAAGLARIEQEAAHVRFEQFFTPELARQLADQPTLLQGRDCEVTFLVCEIRGFTSISEGLGPAGTVDWIGDVLGTLSQCVLSRQGVLVDYVGDQLLAMWGAPEERSDHPRLACQAALAMLEQLAELNKRWQRTLSDPIRLGIGLNTGVARVGNIGSRYKFKYGPLGSTVTLAGWVQEATREWGCPLLITGATHARLDDSFPSRRLGVVQAADVAAAVEIYELAEPGRRDWKRLRQQYEQALAEFEGNNYLAATRILSDLLGDHPDDVPSLKLLSRAVGRLAGWAGERAASGKTLAG